MFPAFIRTAPVEARGSLAGHLRAYSAAAEFHIHDCFFNFCQLTSEYVFWMQAAKCTRPHIHTQTIRAVAGRHSGLHPVVSLHASKLFSVTQILIWKSQLTELTESRERKAAEIHCPRLAVPFFQPLCSIWLIPFDASSCSSLFYVHFTRRMLKSDCLATEALVTEE